MERLRGSVSHWWRDTGSDAFFEGTLNFAGLIVFTVLLIGLLALIGLGIAAL